MKNFSKIFTATIISLSLSSCAVMQNFLAPKPAPQLDYIDGATKMDIKKFFNGDVDGFAIKQDSTGKIVGTVTAKINGKWDENKGVIQQNFVYSDGTKDSRTWLVTVDSDGTFDAVGHDVSVPAKGKQSGNAAQSLYSLVLGAKGEKIQVNFEERMYLIDEKSMIMIVNFDKKKSDQNSAGKIIFSLVKKTAN